MRGKVTIYCIRTDIVGITPAYAGKSPRLSGSCCTRAGSPPPMRGKAEFDCYVSKIRRITPAYAGKSGKATPITHSIKDHPRLCGEKLRFRRSRRHHKGSPPPMRGKVIHTLV